MLPTERIRARQICHLAIEKASLDSTKEWIRRDGYGTWEKQAIDLLDSSREKAASLGMSEEQVNGEIAQYMVLLAIEAELSHAKKQGKGKGKKRNRA